MTTPEVEQHFIEHKQLGLLLARDAQIALNALEALKQAEQKVKDEATAAAEVLADRDETIELAKASLAHMESEKNALRDERDALRDERDAFRNEKDALAAELEAARKTIVQQQEWLNEKAHHESNNNGNG